MRGSAMTMGEAVSRPAAETLTAGQVARSVLIGIVLWFTAAMTVRFFGGEGIFSGLAGVATFAATIGLGWVTPKIAQALAGLDRNQLPIGIIWGTWAATCLDGTFLCWYPAFYHADPAVALAGAAWILWGAGWILVLSLVSASRPAR